MMRPGMRALLADISRQHEARITRRVSESDVRAELAQGWRRFYVVPGPPRAIVYQRPDGSGRVVVT